MNDGFPFLDNRKGCSYNLIVRTHRFAPTVNLHLVNSKIGQVGGLPLHFLRVAFNALF